MGITSIFTYSLPQLTEQFGYYGIIFCRMIQGFCQGIVYPMLANFLSKWVPEEERSFATTFVYAGGDLGTVIATALAGYYASSRLGWPFTFLLYGILGGIWTIMFAIFGSNSPETHRGISEHEVWHITKGKKPNKQTKKTPWKKIFTSLPVWSLWICTISSYWGYWILSMEVPLFMSDILGFNISLDSFYMTLVYFVSWLMSFPSGGCTQFIINRNIATVGNTRKIINSIAFFIPGLCLIGIGVIQGSDYRRCVTLLIVAIIFDSFQYSSYYPNYIDISPHYCGTLFGIGQWVATVFTIFCPLLRNSTLREREQYSSQWENLFLYTAAMYFISNIIYLIFGTGKIQEWNFYDEEDDDDANESTMLLFQRTKNEGP
ncbi:hypothetical protein HHI36_014088 [Cryptolaemus montrouzieri]|uniref:Major facilitator superfamily (MFS) profile domain-containing protein n=1 Tax=Cryptolaemus montrouzieri TaxID=559131 RepID=A0ABD2N2Q8_9CUCU